MTTFQFRRRDGRPLDTYERYVLASQLRSLAGGTFAVFRSPVDPPGILRVQLVNEARADDVAELLSTAPFMIESEETS